MKKQPWISNAFSDSLFILFPPFFCLLAIILFPSVFQNTKGMPDAAWVILILLIDVAHVYSTLYRTYFDSNSFRKQRSILLAIPFIGFIAGVLAYSIDNLFFWRLLAYVAVFHFIRQQYGFMKVYSRKDVSNKLSRTIDKVTIYYAAIYPMLYWHLNGPRNFNWFVDDDFIYLYSPWLLRCFTILYFLIVGCYLLKEIIIAVKNKYLNVPKAAVITGTLLSWYFGIVYFNGDMAFTLLNVVSHGIPYIALIWMYGKKKYAISSSANKFLRIVFSKYGIAIFLGLIFLFAFVEEGLWDVAVWQEHDSIFGTTHLASINLPDKALAFIVPLLALPQITHYILDGFIWRIKGDEFKWNNEVLAKPQS